MAGLRGETGFLHFHEDIHKLSMPFPANSGQDRTGAGIPP